MERPIKLIEKLANELNFVFKKEDYNYIKILAEHKHLITFLKGRPYPESNEFKNRDVKERAGKLGLFLKSSLYKKLKNKGGGCVSSRECFNEELKSLNLIKDLKLKKLIKKIYKRLEKLHKKTKYIVIVTEYNERVLLHEYIHLLLKTNNIKFQKINKKYWIYDEGLTTYLEYYILGELNRLNKLNITNDNMYKIYIKNAKMFYSLLDKHKYKKIIIKKFYNSLKKG